MRFTAMRQSCERAESPWAIGREQYGVKALPLDQSGFSLRSSQFRWRQNVEVRADRPQPGRSGDDGNAIQKGPKVRRPHNVNVRQSTIRARGRHPYQIRPFGS